jgi:hypothetical protein
MANNKSTITYLIASTILQPHQAHAVKWLWENFNAVNQSITEICDQVERVSAHRGKLHQKLYVIFYNVVIKKNSKAISDIELGSIREVLNEVYRVNKAKIEAARNNQPFGV